MDDQTKNRPNRPEGYKCPVCGFTYDTQELAKRCEAWCTERKSCSLEITQHARENRPQKS